MTHPQFKLISFHMCPYVQRARITLGQSQLPYEVEFINLDSPPDWFYDISPLEKVPVLLADDEPVFESMVICEYINEISGGRLYPDDALQRARYRAWVTLGDSLQGLIYDLIHAETKAEFNRARATLQDRFELVEEELSAGPYYGGEAFSMVDVVFAPVFRFIDGIKRYSGLDLLEDTPQCASWAAALLQVPAVQQAAPPEFGANLRNYLARPGCILKDMIEQHG